MAIMSFAHLKNKNNRAEKKAAPIILPVQEAKEAPKLPRMFRIPAVMPSALLIAVNYCQGCGRFSPAGETEKENGNKYGRCLRTTTENSDEKEVWRVIPETAEVGRCYFFMNWRDNGRD